MKQYVVGRFRHRAPQALLCTLGTPFAKHSIYYTYIHCFSETGWCFTAVNSGAHATQYMQSDLARGWRALTTSAFSGNTP